MRDYVPAVQVRTCGFPVPLFPLKELFVAVKAVSIVLPRLTIAPAMMLQGDREIERKRLVL